MQLKQRLWSIPLAITLLLTMSMPVAAYQLAPSARFSGSAIADGNLTICYGESSGEQIYVHRGHIQNYLIQSWGYYGNITFSSNGVCNNDGSNLQLKWADNWTCGSNPYGSVQTWPWEWDQLTLLFNADCHYDNKFDYDSNGPLGGWGESTDAGKTSFSRLVAHEVGHALGIGHSEDNRSLMYSGSGDVCSSWGSSQGVSLDDTNAMKDEYNDFGYTWTHGMTNAPALPTCYG